MSDTERTTSARAIHELASSRRPRSNPSPPRSAASVDESNTSSTFNPDNDDALMSTRHNINDDDSHFLPKLRTTAQQRRFYNPEPQPHVPTSAVRREFGDFDHSNSTDDELEVGRGIGNTPSKPNKSLDSDILLDIGNSIYEVTGTPPARSKPTARSSLRKEASLRRASGTRVNGTTKSYAKPNTKENRAAHTEDYGFTTRTTRFGSRTFSADNDIYERPSAGTPQQPNGTPRGIANSTAQSFLLPDMPNLTELVGGSYKDSTPIISRSGRAGARISSVNPSRRPNQPNFLPVRGIPIPQEEKAILAALEILKEKVAEMEEDKAKSDRKILDYQFEISDLRAQMDAQDNIRRSDSALGSTDGEAPANQKHKWKIEKTRMEASMQVLQHRIEQADQKVSTADSARKRVTQERDSLVTQLGLAIYNSEELKNKNRLLQDQVTDLQQENQELVAENEQLRSQCDQSHNRHEDETHRWAKKEAALNRKANTNDRVAQENQTLRDDLVLAQELQIEAERAAQVEHAKLTVENEKLKTELEQAKASREAELKRWAGKQAELQAHIDHREETIHQLQATVPQEQINEDLRQENQVLKAQLARYRAENQVEEQGTPKDVLRKRLEEVTNHHVQDTERWLHKESRLRDRLEQEREMNELHRQIEAIRTEGRPSNNSNSKTKRRSTGQIGLAVSDETAWTSRSRSKSRSRTATRRSIPRAHRHVSAPVTSAFEDEAEVSDASTTDLSFDPAILAGAPKSGGHGKRPTGFVPAHTGDTTFLSYIDGNEIENLRRRLEEERKAARQRKAPATAEAVEDEVTGYGLRRRNSQKDLTSRSRASSRARSVLSVNAESDFEPSNDGGRPHKEETIRSNLSRVSRTSHRRRQSSAGFTEMTSAFILPDITLHARKDATSQDLLQTHPSHDAKSCTVCQLILSNAPADIEISIPPIVPVTERSDYQADIDATIRPSQPASKALAAVIKSMQDELTHLKLELSVLTARLRTSDPSLGKRSTNALHAQIEKLNRAIKVKNDSIYSLYDVIEAHKDQLIQMGEEDGLPEELEKTLESIRVERARLNVTTARGKRVGFGPSAAVESHDEDSDLPWGGISDTEGL